MGRPIADLPFSVDQLSVACGIAGGPAEHRRRRGLLAGVARAGGSPAPSAAVAVAPTLSLSGATGRVGRRRLRAPRRPRAGPSGSAHSLKPDYVSHLVHDLTSIVALLEHEFNRPAVTYRNEANELTDFLDLDARVGRAPTFLEPPQLGAPARVPTAWPRSTTEPRRPACARLSGCAPATGAGVPSRSDERSSGSTSRLSGAGDPS